MLKGADNCLGYMEVFGHPRLNYAQLRRGDYKLQEQEEWVKKKVGEEGAILEPLHPAEPDATWPPVEEIF